MVKAVLIPLETSFEVIIETLPKYGIRGSQFKISKTTKNSSMIQKLMRSLDFDSESDSILISKNPSSVIPRLASGPPPSLIRPKDENLYNKILSKDQTIFIEESHTLETALKTIFGSSYEYNIKAVGYILYKNQDQWTQKIMYQKNGLSGFSDEESQDIEDEDFEVSLELLKISKQKGLEFLNSYSKSRTRNYERAKNKILETSTELQTLNKKLEKFEVFTSSKNFKTPENELNNPLLQDLALNCKKTSENIKKCTQRCTELLNSNLALKKPNFYTIQLPLSSYTDNMIELHEEQSGDNKEHIFTIINNSSYNLTHLNLYKFDSESEPKKILNPFAIEAKKTCVFQEDYFIEEIRYKGCIEFQVYFSIFPVSKSIEVNCIDIINVIKHRESSKCEIELKSHVSACNDVQVILNDTVLARNFKIKNFQSSRLQVDMQGYKGRAVFHLSIREKRISNKFHTEVY